MDLLLYLEKILSDFRPLFNQQNFMLFQALIFGFIAASLTKLIFTTTQPAMEMVSVEDVCQQLGIHWYRPVRLTLGLRVAFLRLRIVQTLFSVSSKQKSYMHNITHIFQQIKDKPMDKAT